MNQTNHKKYSMASQNVVLYSDMAVKTSLQVDMISDVFILELYCRIKLGVKESFYCYPSVIRARFRPGALAAWITSWPFISKYQLDAWRWGTRLFW